MFSAQYVRANNGENKNQLEINPKPNIVNHDQVTDNQSTIQHDGSQDKKREEANVENIVRRLPEPATIIH